MVTFHGTTLDVATGMANGSNPIDVVNHGKGEFGKGFYCQCSPANALQRALSKTNRSRKPCVLEIDIPDHTYYAFTRRQLSKVSARRLRYYINRTMQKATYTSRHDVIVGPLLPAEVIEQQKFQSEHSQNTINGVFVRKRVQ